MEIKIGDIVSFVLNTQWIYVVIKVDIENDIIYTRTISTPPKSRSWLGYKGSQSSTQFKFVTSPSPLEEIIYGI